MSTQGIENSHLSRTHPGVRALDDVWFALESGAVHALLGENKAGESTRIVTVVIITAFVENQSRW